MLWAFSLSFMSILVCSSFETAQHQPYSPPSSASTPPSAPSSTVPTAQRPRYESSPGDDDGVLQFRIEHALSHQENAFGPRNKIQIEFSKLSRAGAVKMADYDFSQEEVELFKALRARDGLYRIRLIPESSKPTATESDRPVAAFVKANTLHQSGYRELIIFHCDMFGNVIALDYHTAGNISQPQSADSVTIRSKGKVSFGRQGERPFEFKPPSEAQAAGESQSWFSRYWYYILPIGLVVLMSNVMGPSDDGGRGGGGARRRG